jgi:hypothetical protein
MMNLSSFFLIFAYCVVEFRCSALQLLDAAPENFPILIS